eukprot:1145840-Pelagomonas_calceolata.AAC.4
MHVPPYSCMQACQTYPSTHVHVHFVPSYPSCVRFRPACTHVHVHFVPSYPCLRTSQTCLHTCASVHTSGCSQPACGGWHAARCELHSGDPASRRAAGVREVMGGHGVWVDVVYDVHFVFVHMVCISSCGPCEMTHTRTHVMSIHTYTRTDTALSQAEVVARSLATAQQQQKQQQQQQQQQENKVGHAGKGGSSDAAGMVPHGCVEFQYEARRGGLGLWNSVKTIACIKKPAPAFDRPLNQTSRPWRVKRMQKKEIGSVLFSISMAYTGQTKGMVLSDMPYMDTWKD